MDKELTRTARRREDARLCTILADGAPLAAALKLHRLRPEDIALEMHCHPETVRRALRNPNKSKRAAIYMMTKFHMATEDVFHVSSRPDTTEVGNATLTV
jgi:hypothetical protein